MKLVPTNPVGLYRGSNTDILLRERSNIQGYAASRPPTGKHLTTPQLMIEIWSVLADLGLAWSVYTVKILISSSISFQVLNLQIVMAEVVVRITLGPI